MGWSFNGPWESKAPTVPSSTGHSLPSANPSTEIFGFTNKKRKKHVVVVVVVVAASATCNHFFMDLSWVNHSSRITSHSQEGPWIGYPNTHWGWCIYLRLLYLSMEHVGKLYHTLSVSVYRILVNKQHTCILSESTLWNNSNLQICYSNLNMRQPSCESPTVPFIDQQRIPWTCSESWPVNLPM